MKELSGRPSKMEDGVMRRFINIPKAIVRFVADVISVAPTQQQIHDDLGVFLEKSIFGSKGLDESGAKGDARLRGNATEKPPGITWNPSLHAEKAKQVFGSQYNIDQDIDGIPDGNSWGYNLCGHISLEIILEAITDGDLFLTDLFYALGGTKDTTGTEELARALAKIMSDRDLPVDYLAHVFGIKIHHTPNGLHDVYESDTDKRYTSIDSGYSTWMIEALQKGHYYIPLINMDTRAEGVLCPKMEVKHWVVVTGFSSKWDYDNPFSRWNWIRIRNPFRNTEEYYWWGEFRLSVEAGLGIEVWET